MRYLLTSSVTLFLGAPILAKDVALAPAAAAECLAFTKPVDSRKTQLCELGAFAQALFGNHWYKTIPSKVWRVRRYF
ncbi:MULTISPECIES: hypothetical protein [unclassified Pseudomonas]|uniref:hypothetical protein n=1 Tax=unclassified Pseudomonas TaxID=196821 RepID=UPI00131DFA04|nr:MULTISPECIES: hypothetical protein [unclassified Pseudomonas]